MSDVVKETHQEKPNIKGDKVNIMLLMFLYFLQGGTSSLRLGLPIILQNRNVSYADQVRTVFTARPPPVPTDSGRVNKCNVCSRV